MSSGQPLQFSRRDRVSKACRVPKILATEGIVEHTQRLMVEDEEVAIP